MIVNNINYVEKKDAGNAILEFIKNNNDIDKEVEFGQYKGFDMKLGFSILGKNFYVVLKNNESYTVPLGTDPLGNITRIDNELNKLSQYLDNNRNKLETTKQQFEIAKEEEISKRTLENAKRELNISAKKINNTWYWDFEKIKKN